MECSFYEAYPELGDRDGSFFLRTALLHFDSTWKGRHVSLEPL
jgi:hypothetical protein